MISAADKPVEADRKTLICQDDKFKRTGPAIATALNIIRICIFMLEVNSITVSLETNGDAKKNASFS
jgi:hypothetical protein